MRTTHKTTTSTLSNNANAKQFLPPDLILFWMPTIRDKNFGIIHTYHNLL